MASREEAMADFKTGVGLSVEVRLSGGYFPCLSRYSPHTAFKAAMVASKNIAESSGPSIGHSSKRARS